MYRPAKPGTAEWRRDNLLPESRALEWGAGASALWWSILTALPDGLFHSNPSFSQFAHIGPQIGWTVPIHLVMLIVVVGWFNGIVWVRLLGMFSSTVLWIFVAGAFFVAAPSWHGVALNTGLGPYGSTAILCFWATVRLSGLFFSDLRTKLHTWRHRDEGRVVIVKKSGVPVRRYEIAPVQIPPAPPSITDAEDRDVDDRGQT